jgi:hypothetical protein
MGHVEPVVTLLLSPVGTACQQAVNILLLDQATGIAAANKTRVAAAEHT